MKKESIIINRLNPKIVSLTLAIVSGIFYIICALFFLIFPNFTLNLFNDMFHGIDITQISKATMSFGSFVTGFLTVYILSLIAGWLFAVIYNYLQKKREEV